VQGLLGGAVRRLALVPGALVPGALGGAFIAYSALLGGALLLTW